MHANFRGEVVVQIVFVSQRHGACFFELVKVGKSE
jgi:hypothetical protein